MSLITSAFAQNQGSGGVAQVKPGASVSATLFVQANNSAAPFSLSAPSSVLEGRQIRVLAGGRLFVHGTTPTVITSLYGVAGGVPSSSPASAASYTSLASQSAQTLTTNASYPWMIEALLQGDSTSGIVQGQFRVIVNNVATAWAALSATLTGVNFGPAPSTPTPANASVPFTLVVGVTFGVSDVLNTANLNQFDFSDAA